MKTMWETMFAAACVADCGMGIDVRRRATDIARIRDVADDFIV